jgi:hypothetical protein
MSPGEIMFKSSQFISFNNIMLLTDDNVPHTTQPPLTKFCEAVSLQKPLIIDSSNAFEGGSFDGTLYIYFSLFFLSLLAQTFFFHYLFSQYRYIKITLGTVMIAKICQYFFLSALSGMNIPCRTLISCNSFLFK